MEPGTMREMLQLKRLEELDLINPQCNWGNWPPTEKESKARSIYNELLRQCGAYEVEMGY